VASLIGTVYLLHFDRPLAHARHYTGWSANLPLRLAEHRAGHGARLTEVVAGAGIGWRLARTWPNTTRADERRLKKQGGASRRCPLCGTKPRLRQPDPVIALPEWTESGAGHALRFEAVCEACRTPRGMFDFDLATPGQRVCCACQAGGG
jgi:predicted GIY-YIG superfamily endonuclease